MGTNRLATVQADRIAVKWQARSNIYTVRNSTCSKQNGAEGHDIAGHKDVTEQGYYYAAVKVKG